MKRPAAKPDPARPRKRPEGLRLREGIVATCEGPMHMFRTRPHFFPPDLYVCDPEEYYHWFADLELTPGPDDLPFVA